MSIKDELDALTDQLRGMKADHRETESFYQKPKVPSDPRRGPSEHKSGVSGGRGAGKGKPLSTERIWGAEMRAPGRTLRWRKRLGVDQDRNRTILELRRQGKPYAEIGERFGISVSAVAGIVFRHAQKFEVRK